MSHVQSIVDKMKAHSVQLVQGMDSPDTTRDQPKTSSEIITRVESHAKQMMEELFPTRTKEEQIAITMKTLLPRNAPSEANLDKEDIQIVMDQAQCKREEAIYAMRLTAKNGQVNIVDAILELTP